MTPHPILDQISALLDLDADGALVPHGIGGHARTLLTDAATLIETQAERNRELDRELTVLKAMVWPESGGS